MTHRQTGGTFQEKCDQFSVEDEFLNGQIEFNKFSTNGKILQNSFRKHLSRTRIGLTFLGYSEKSKIDLKHIDQNQYRWSNMDVLYVESTRHEPTRWS